MIQSVAFIGLGAMGFRMAAHLPKQFDTVYVWNRSFNKAEQHAAEYGTQAVTLEQAVQADVIFHACQLALTLNDFWKIYRLNPVQSGSTAPVVYRILPKTGSTTG